MPQAVQAHKTSDGLLFEDAEKAALHEAETMLRHWLTQVTTPGGSDAEWAAFLVQNAQGVHAALDGIIQARKGPVMRGGS